ncbi:hypothetical protein BD309DRAFT_175624 [Dichomitus squalens]|uniref:Uncharacterized protein n=1 Tax=Dichomitus squalens TaxID=114155 RepID=A0A4Q9QFC4_9APHY|nr:hypothetical protein BD309DRAFT_175624 [Dichomitus squalens]TBU66100.1 hypothetical protein BD310DRAFT_41757 [Dichomitus squalens]
MLRIVSSSFLFAFGSLPIRSPCCRIRPLFSRACLHIANPSLTSVPRCIRPLLPAHASQACHTHHYILTAHTSTSIPQYPSIIATTCSLPSLPLSGSYPIPSQHQSSPPPSYTRPLRPRPRPFGFHASVARAWNQVSAHVCL